MTQRVNFSILFCTISILTAQAQWIDNSYQCEQYEESA